ncbi:MAG: hypothetical protein Q7R93_00625 [bacterium]|nr:hypothetical protein [bacterium]
MENLPKKNGGKIKVGNFGSKLVQALEGSQAVEQSIDIEKQQDLEIVARKKAKMIAEQKQFDKDPIGTTYHAKDRRIRNLERNITNKTNEQKVTPEKD